MAVSPEPPQPLRVRWRRAQLVVGLGVVALVLGSGVSAGLTLRLSARAAELPSLLRWALYLGVGRLWLLLLLPLLCHGAARMLALRPRATALGAALSGEALLVALDLARAGPGGTWPGLPLALVRAGTLALGVWLSERALKAGALLREAREQHAREQAEATREEYAALLARAGGTAGQGGEATLRPPSP
ncbi:MAG TPA: hypothetical protein VFO83_11670 [Aggregicoccus sp.]|nr:hypothetical protein [Aggregicoccus sp.]